MNKQGMRTAAFPVWTPFGLAVALAVLTVAAFWGTWRNGFVNYDDNTYVFLNPNVVRGLDWQTVEWAFGYVNACHWVPLTWLSHALDCQLFGLDPAGHHLSSLVLHTASVVVLFAALRSLTGSLWRSALVAALFGIHPLRVESVAWVAERKDVLSGLFFMLTLLTYACYAKQVKEFAAGPGAVEGSRRPWIYWFCLGTFACGLLSKPMLVTLPCLLLLLDYWPLQRLDLAAAANRAASLLALVKEKIPFFFLSAVACYVTYSAQLSAKAGAGNTTGIPLLMRLGNAALACVAYVRQTLWPTDMAVFYPPQIVTLFTGRVLLAVLGLLLLTALVVSVWRRSPAMTVGWFWFLGVLVPVSGIVQAGEMIQADRFTYLPAIGLYLMIAWLGGELVARWPVAQKLVLLISVAGLGFLGSVTQRQLQVWRDTETLFTHAARVTKENHVALAALAEIEIAQGKIAEATRKVETIIRVAPGFPRGECLMATLLQMQGRMAEAIPHLQRSVGPEVGIAGQARMVLSLMDVGRLTEAEALLDQLLQIMPNNPEAWLMKAALLREQGRVADAAELFRKIIAAYEPKGQDTPLFNFELAELFCLVGQSAKAGPFYERAVTAFPNYLDALNNYAWYLATDPNDAVRNGVRAVELAQKACEVSQWKQSVVMGTLAAALAEAGRFDEAVKMAERAREKAETQGATALAKRNGELADLYRRGQPYRDRPQ